MLKNQILILFLCLNFFKLESSDLEFVILIPSYNNAKLDVDGKITCLRNLESAISQKTEHKFDILCINDRSTDNTLELINNYVKEKKLEDKVTLINNQERVGALANIYNGVHNLQGNKIVAILDGDDFLAPNAIDIIAQEYDPNIWLTYGQYKSYPAKLLSCCEEIPKLVIGSRSFRKYKWVTSHLKTFRASLFKKIKKEDLLDAGGNFYQMSSDLSFMFPMLEMASKGHIKFISEVIYHYNFSNPISDHRINSMLQRKIDKEIRSKTPYKALDSLE